MEKDNLEMILEDIKEKFDLVLEGHSVLSNKIDRLDVKLSDRIDFLDAKIDSVEKRLSAKIDSVANDVAAHRADTESHPKGYKVSE